MNTTKCLWCDKDIEILLANKPPKYCRDNWKCKANFTLYKSSLNQLKDLKPNLYASYYNNKVQCVNFNYCKQRFIPIRSTHIFCSENCHRIISGRKKIEQKYCLYCENKIAKNRKFCDNNHECKTKYSHHPLPERKLYCIQCNKEFIAKHPQAKACSQACKSRFSYLKNRDVNFPYKKVCTICGIKYTTKKYNQTICLSYECKNERLRKRYIRYRTLNPNNFKEKEGYIYCMYSIEYNVYKIGITHKPKYRTTQYERIGFVPKALYKFNNKHEALLAEKEFYIQAESMGISPRKNDTENNKFFDTVFKSYAGKTEIIYGEMIRFNELRKMLNSLMGEVIN